MGITKAFRIGFFWVIMGLGAINFCNAGVALNDKDIVRAVLGEAIGESQLGKEAIARTIINRKSLRGVYGLKNPIIKQAKASDYLNATNALTIARTRDITNGAIGWGNAQDIKIFKKSKWFKRCYITKQIGNHYFYNCSQ